MEWLWNCFLTRESKKKKWGSRGSYTFSENVHFPGVLTCQLDTLTGLYSGLNSMFRQRGWCQERFLRSAIPPPTPGGGGRMIAVNSRPAWATWWVPDQPELQSGAMSQSKSEEKYCDVAGKLDHDSQALVGDLFTGLGESTRVWRWHCVLWIHDCIL